MATTLKFEDKNFEEGKEELIYNPNRSFASNKSIDTQLEGWKNTPKQQKMISGEILLVEDFSKVKH